MDLNVPGRRVEIPLRRIPGTHFFSLPATVGGVHSSSLIFDTGIGLSFVSCSLAERMHCAPTGGSFAGRRMSGQEVSMPLVSLESLAVGPVVRKKAVVGSFDIFGAGTKVPDGFAGVEGFLSPAFFDGIPFTLELARDRILVESSESLSHIQKAGKRVPLELKRDAPSITMFMEMVLPDGQVAAVEVDTGSGILILDSTYMNGLGIRTTDRDTRSMEGKDETGNGYLRYFARMGGSVHVRFQPDLVQPDPEVMFQEIIYDGLVGVDFLSRYSVTFDLAGSELIFNGL